MKARTLSEEQCQSCLSMSTTHTKSQIAKLHGVQTYTIQNLFKKHGIKPKYERRRWSRQDLIKLFKYLADHTHAEAAEMLGVTVSIVDDLSYRYGIDHGYFKDRGRIRTMNCQTIGCGKEFLSRHPRAKYCGKCKRDKNKLRVMFMRNPEKADKQLEFIEDSEAETRASMQRIACDNMLLKFGLTSQDITSVTSRIKNGNTSGREAEGKKSRQA